jgi:hypothetical protein
MRLNAFAGQSDMGKAPPVGLDVPDPEVGFLNSFTSHLFLFVAFKSFKYPQIPFPTVRTRNSEYSHARSHVCQISLVHEM